MTNEDPETRGFIEQANEAEQENPDAIAQANAAVANGIISSAEEISDEHPMHVHIAENSWEDLLQNGHTANATNVLEMDDGTWAIHCPGCGRIFQIEHLNIDELTTVCIRTGEEYTLDRVFICPGCTHMTPLINIETTAGEWLVIYNQDDGWTVKCENCNHISENYYPIVGENAVEENVGGKDCIYHKCPECNRTTYMYHRIVDGSSRRNYVASGTCLVEDIQQGDVEKMIIPRSNDAVKAIKHCIANTVGIREEDINLFIYCNSLDELITVGKTMDPPAGMDVIAYRREMIIFKNSLASYQQRTYLRVCLGNVTKAIVRAQGCLNLPEEAEPGEVCTEEAPEAVPRRDVHMESTPVPGPNPFAEGMAGPDLDGLVREVMQEEDAHLIAALESITDIVTGGECYAESESG